MNKKIIASVCGAAVLATAVYFGGVFILILHNKQ